MFKSRGGLVCPLLALVLTFAGGISVNAQQVFGNIYGTITDATGGAVTNAKVTITDTAKGTQSVVTSDASGNYAKGQLIPDPYTVSVEAPGFQKVISNAITVRVDEAARFDVALKVGEAKEVIEVTAAAPLLQTDRADVAQTFDSKQIEELPNIGRNAQSMELLQPGTARIGWQHASDENPQGSVQMVADGQLFDSMGYELDGTTNQDPILGIIVINPTFDSLSEMKQANQNFDAEFDYAVNMASYSTKSGTNSLHADAFEYLNLNTPGFQTYASTPSSWGSTIGYSPSPVFRENQFGGSIGGRLIKDKLFFFGDAQLTREAEGGSVTTSVPTAANLQGNFSDYAAYAAANNANYMIYDPLTGDQSTGVGRTPFSGCATPGYCVPTSRLSPQAVAIAKNWYGPNVQNTPGVDFANNYYEQGNTSIIDNQWNTREDYYLNSRNTLFGRYSYFAGYEAAPGAFGSAAGGPSFGHYAGSSTSVDHSIAFGWTDTLSATTVNEFRFGFMQYYVFDVPNGYGTQPATAAGIPGLNLDNTYTSGLPAFYVNNPTGPQDQLGYALGVNQCNCPLTQRERQYQFVDNLSTVHGNHTFKMGADLRYATNLRVPSDSHRAGELTFNGQEVGSVSAIGANATPGIGMAAFLLGDVGSFNRYVSSSTNAMESQPRLFFYGQDTWRPTSKLTLNIGLRYEFIPPEAVNGTGNGATFDLNRAEMVVFGYNQVSSHGIQNPQYHDFAPRIGIAYQLNEKTVVRAGYGWSYDLGVFGSNFGHNVTQNPPVLSNQSLTAPNNFQDVFTLAQGPSLPPPVTINSDGTFLLPAGVSPKFRPAQVTLPTIYQYNASIQRQVTSKIAVTGAYVGNANRHGFLGTGNSFNLNVGEYNPGGSPIYPYANLPAYGTTAANPLTLGTTNLSYYCDCSNENYNSFQGSVNIKAMAGWTVQGSYTYQRQWGVGWGYNDNYDFVYNRAADYGYTNTLPRNQITVAQNFDIPVGKGRKYMGGMNRAADFVIGGWNVSGVTTFYSGFPFQPTLGNSYTAATGWAQPNTGPTNRPELGTTINYGSNRTEWFSASKIVLPGANQFGNYPINTLFGPNFIQQDLSLAKTFKMTEKVGFTFRWDSSNLFNRLNLGLPNTNIDQSNVGQITSLAAGTGGFMRRMQFSGTVRF